MSGFDNKIVHDTHVVNNGKIYVIIFPNYKLYFGATMVEINERKNKHKQAHMRKTKTSKLYQAFDEFGIDNVLFCIVENNIPEDMLKLRERYYIAKYNTVENGYNTSYGESQLGGNPYKINSIEIVLEIYDMLRDDNILIKDIANKFSVTGTLISNMNEGKVHAIHSKNSYPIRKTYKKLSEDIVMDMVKDLKNAKLGITKFKNKTEMHETIAKKYNKTRKSIGNIDNGTVHNKILKDNGVVDFPISGY